MVVNPFRCLLYWADSKSAQIWQVSTSMKNDVPRRLASLTYYTYRSNNQKKLIKNINNANIIMTIFEVSFKILVCKNRNFIKILVCKNRNFIKILVCKNRNFSILPKFFIQLLSKFWFVKIEILVKIKMLVKN